MVGKDLAVPLAPGDEPPARHRAPEGPDRAVAPRPLGLPSHPLLDAAPAMLWLADRNGALTFVGKPLLDFTGRRPDQVLGFGRAALIHPEDRAAAADAFAEALAARRPFTAEYRIRTADGGYRWVLDNGAPRRTGRGRFLGMIGAMTDITGRKLAEEALREREALLRHAARLARLGHWVWDEVEDRCIFCSEELARIHGMTVAEYMRECYSTARILERIHPEDRERYRLVEREAALNGGTYEAEFRLLTPSGEVRHVREIGERVQEGGAPSRRAVGVLQDITDLKGSEAELLAAKERAEAASRSKSRFLAHMSHELRTPLNAIIGFSAIIKDQLMGPVGVPQYRDYADDIHQSGEHLLAVINDILDLSKIEAGRFELHEEPCDIAALVEACLRVMRERAGRAGVGLGRELAPGLPRLYADPRAVKQILLNLLSDGVKFTPPGGRVAVRAALAAGGGLALTVADTGVGMEKEAIPRALEAFAQIDNALSRRYEGSGLGLAIVKGLCEMHGATLRLESAPGRGTTATVAFPRQRSMVPAEAAAAP